MDLMAALEHLIQGHFVEPIADPNAARMPQPGDAVVLTERWEWGGMPVGCIGIIGGLRRTCPLEVGITFHSNTFMDKSSVSCSGGPGTIGTPSRLLKKTGRTYPVLFWKWKDGISGEGRAEYYWQDAVLWEWDGKSE